MANQEEFPVGFALYFEDLEYSQAISFCNDFAIDVLEVTVYNFNTIVFFDHHGLDCCRVFSCSNDFKVIFYTISSLFL